MPFLSPGDLPNPGIELCFPALQADSLPSESPRNTQKNYTKKVNDLDNHDDVVIHLESDILKCEVKWTLRRITVNKASGGDGIPAELFQILKDDAVKVLHSEISKFGKHISGHRTGKDQF